MEKNKPPQDIVKQAQELIKKYIDYMSPLRQRWIENEEWYKSRHWELIRNQKFQNDPEPTTAFVLSTIANKHADYMDFYPKPIIKPREQADEDEAKRLSEIIPVELEWNDFQDTWSEVAMDKLKLGPGIYGVLFDPNGNNGIGSNVIKSIDPINFYCDPFVKKLSESKGVFITELIDKEEFKEIYPEANAEKAGKLFEPSKYTAGEKRDTTDMILVIDYYYLGTNEEGNKVVHYLKFAGDEKLYWSEESEHYSDGYYKLEQYPFEIDALYPEKDNIFGFGMIDVIKSPQIYIDKLDQIILSNTFAHSRKRYFYKESAGINEKDFLDPSKPLVKASAISEEHIREIKTEPTHANVSNHRNTKIAELKETSTANEFSRGETNSGVTAAQAIVALQKASGKTSRAMITQSYSCFSKVVYIYVELMRQFYDTPRSYRVDDLTEQSGMRYVDFDNTSIQPQQLESLGEEPKFRKPMFDFKIEAQKQDPFSEAAQNEMAKELYGMGVFNPEMFLQSKILLGMMEFEGKEKVLRELEMNAGIQQQLMMGQRAMVENQKLKMIVQGVTGEDLGVDMGVQNGSGGNPQAQ